MELAKIHNHHHLIKYLQAKFEASSVWIIL